MRGNYAYRSVSINTGSGCNYSICLDITETEIEEGLSLVVHDGESALYTLSLTPNAQNCFENLTLPENFQLQLHASVAGSYYVDNISITKKCVEFKYYVAHVTSAKDYYPFGSIMPGRSFNAGTYRYGGAGGQEMDNEIAGVGNSYTAKFWQYDSRLGRRWNIDPVVKHWESSYATFNNNPILMIDPKGDNANPIYDKDGDFLGTDDEGLQGDAIVMDKKDFKQGMSHEDAMDKGTTFDNLPMVYSNEFRDKIQSHYSGLKDRPDYDGFVTIDEGVQWAKDHPNTLPDNITPDNSLYLDASKLNFGDLSVDNIGLKQGQKGNVNLFDYVHWTSSSSRATTYALGNTQVKLLNADAGTIKLFWDDYNWDYHNNPPSGTRDRLIQAERWRSGVNSSHGFRIFMFGTGTIKK